MYGPDNQPEKSVLHRLIVTEAMATELRDMARRIQWLIVAGVIVGILNLLIKSAEFRLPTPSASSAAAGK